MAKPRKSGRSDRGPVIDPTRNVLHLVAAESRRHDDLRLEAERLSAIKHQHSRELIELQAAHSKDLREAETKRLDAIREVDVTAAQLIANQVSNTAEALRALVSTTAETLARQTTTTTGQLSDRIAQLERSSYEGSGKSAVADPMMARMVETMEALRTNMDQGQGGNARRVDTRGGVLMIVAIVSAVIAAISLFNLLAR